ncbi:prepilin-type N-terminal cleavage/methylation domain-containing protein [bacterium]|nr:prepilin-type N-terminal cleavage/methylation domain-containing protein [bacterium]
MISGPIFSPQGRGEAKTMGLGKKGFTLLEMMIALAILAVVLTTLFASYSITLRTIEGSERIAAVYDSARVALERIGDDLEGAYIPAAVDEKKALSGIQSNDGSFLGEDRLDDGRRADRLSLVSHSHARLRPDDPVFGLVRISYFVRSEEEGKGFTLYREESPIPARGSGSYYGALPLCSGLDSFRLSYIDEKGTESDRWDSIEASLPVMVSITLSFIDEGDIETPIIFSSSAVVSSRAEPDAKSSEK